MRANELSLWNDDALVGESRPESTLENYQYSPLPSSDNTIRLLCIPPADHISDPLVCQMRQVKLNDKSEYSALSYTWGSPVFDHHIICDGRRLAITAHLDAALRRFRRTTWWMLWVDALCIDQTDIPERNYQVSIMRRIYSQALRTFVYLGEPCLFNGEALILMIALTQFARRLEGLGLNKLKNTEPRDPATPRARDAVIRLIELENASFPGARTRTTDLLPPGLPHPQHAAWEAMQSLFSSPWFRRMWIIQEVVSSSDVVVMVGEYKLNWELVTKTIHAYIGCGLELFTATVSQNTAIRKNFITSTTSVFNLLRLENDSQYRSLINLLRSFRKCHSSDPRDKVYALVGLANDQGLHEMVQIDYAKSVEAVYLDCAKFLVGNGDGMEMLLQAGIIQTRDGNGGRLSMPSWVPNWSQEMYPYMNRPLEDDRAAGETAPDMKIRDGGIGLSVKGIRIDVIHTLPQFVFPNNERPKDFGVWVQQIKGLSRQKHRFITHEMCVTRRKYIGASPCSSQPGDMIIFLYGGPMPFTVRETNGGYILLGPTYLSGFMNGEALKLEDAEPEHFVLV